MTGRASWSLPVALASLLVLAGCAGLAPAGQQASTPETTVKNFSYPPGWSQDGITDIGLPQQTHSDTVENVSRRTRFVTSDDDATRTIVRTVDVEAGTVSVRSEATLFGTTYAYYSPNGVFEYDPETEEVTLRPDENWTTAGVADVERLDRPLLDLGLAATEIVTVEGVPAVRYNVTGIANRDFAPATGASGYVTVSETGYIAAYNVTRGNDGFTRRTTYDLSEFGNATVERPSWLPEE
ncbi:uncharacterized protein HHUB_2353 [Halobacterium hubeiense]|uniref:Uncharacterized protein n=1 Tax=Halobacterium hubeiense TaxID=1407499 RepID=A0A0U5H3Z8_9EURY|nr:uncharacterized protein HHUB_2353 [Halobacterium hubeiense]